MEISLESGSSLSPLDDLLMNSLNKKRLRIKIKGKNGLVKESRYLVLYVTKDATVLGVSL